jgi:hypothetical protein
VSGIYPGDTRSLGDVERLAAAGEWAVLAALARLAAVPDALGALAAAADREPAFRWMWAVTNFGDPRHAQQIATKLAEAMAAGLNRDRYSGHSLRAGLATAASAAGASQKPIMDQGDWKSVQTVMRYVREGTLFKNNAAASIGL